MKKSVARPESKKASAKGRKRVVTIAKTLPSPESPRIPAFPKLPSNLPTILPPASLPAAIERVLEVRVEGTDAVLLVSLRISGAGQILAGVL